VPDVPALLEKAQERANRRVTRRVGQLVEDLVGGGAPPAVKDVHDLALAAREARRRLRHACLRNQVLKK